MQAHRVLFWAVLEMLNNTEGVESAAAEASAHKSGKYHVLHAQKDRRRWMLLTRVVLE